MSKSNWAVGEAYKASGQYKAGEFIDLRRDLNIHDPENKYQWVDTSEEASKKLLYKYITMAGTGLGALGFLTGIYCLVFLGMLL